MKKNYLKTNLISFITGVLIFSCIGVYAIVNFSSNDVTYDNKESGLSSTNVKGAIDELYIECTKEPTAGETIIENAGLEKDPYECRYFFTGADPNNYITFNDEKAGWRIISVECDGTIKIMKISNINLMTWNTDGDGNWDGPTTLNTYLNSTYYNQLDSVAKSQIIDGNFSIGEITEDNTNLFEQINDENSKKWKGKIALPTVSEYLRTNSNKSSCGTFSLNNNNSNSCKNTTWMFTSNVYNWWALSRPYNGFSSIGIEIINGRIDSGNQPSLVRPTLYLSSNIKIIGGTGTSSDPYQISL